MSAVTLKFIQKTGVGIMMPSPFFILFFFFIVVSPQTVLDDETLSCSY